MEVYEDIVIVGAGIAGLATALGLHRLGIRSLVLESSDTLRTTGFAFTTWPNAWKALDAIGVGDSLRPHHLQIRGLKSISTVSGLQKAERTFNGEGSQELEIRCVQRKNLLETLERELPSGTIKHSSKVVSIQESAHISKSKLIHLADGSIINAKVLIGADGVNSAVAKWLGFKKPAFAGRAAIRGTTYYKHGHGFEPIFTQYLGERVRFGALPCDDKTVYWFFTWYPSPQEKEMEEDPAKMKQFVLSNLGKVPERVRAVFEDTALDNMIMSPLKYRHPWELLWANISKVNVCVTGDAFHPMTPDLGQGGCSALEDGIVLARCLGQAMKNTNMNNSEETESERIEMGLKRYARERRWRGLELIMTAYMAGYLQQGNSKLVTFLRDKVLPDFWAGRIVKMAKFDCGKL